MCWHEADIEERIVVGGNGQEKQSNQLSYPFGLLFDVERNLYVVDWGNHRILSQPTPQPYQLTINPNITIYPTIISSGNNVSLNIDNRGDHTETNGYADGRTRYFNNDSRAAHPYVYSNRVDSVSPNLVSRYGHYSSIRTDSSFNPNAINSNHGIHVEYNCIIKPGVVISIIVIN